MVGARVGVGVRVCEARLGLDVGPPRLGPVEVPDVDNAVGPAPLVDVAELFDEPELVGDLDVVEDGLGVEAERVGEPDGRRPRGAAAGDVLQDRVDDGRDGRDLRAGVM